MNRTVQVIIGIVILLVIVTGSIFFYIWTSGGSGKPSTDISAVIDDSNIGGEGVRFSIVSERSSAQFKLDEDLNGVRNTVVGSTNQVGGDIRINFDDPKDSMVSTIVINARTLTTDQSMRNRMIRSEILKSSQAAYEFIKFVPRAINGLPDVLTVGMTYDFEIVGELTIIDTTKTVTFRTSVEYVSETEISGSATTTVNRTDYGINIPSVSQVANVDEEVVLTLNFVATTGSEEG